MYDIKLENLLKTISVNPEKGLSSEEVKLRIEKYGKNVIVGEKRKTLLDIIASQFKNTVLWLLLIAALISFLIGEEIEGFAILIAIAISVGFGAYLEYKADKSLEKLKKFTEKKNLVLRDGELKHISITELVPGDIIILRTGDFVGADARVLESEDLHLDESHLTGESRPVGKKVGEIKGEAPLSERFNVVFAGSYVVRGEGKAVVYSTGKNTELGKIAKGLEDIIEEETPLMKNINEMGEKITLLSLSLIFLTFLIGLLQGRGLYEVFLYSITLAVASVPEGLTAVLTIMLTFSVLYMARNNALVKKLSAVEAIGNIDLLGVDKTGTITEGRLGLVFVYSKGKLYSLGDYDLDETLIYASLANSGKKVGEKFLGDDIDTAILRAFYSLGGTEELLNKYLKEKEDFIPFSSELKYVELSLDGLKIRKGAYEVILSQTNAVLEDKVKRGKEHVNKWIKVAKRLSKRGYRVIAVSYIKGKTHVAVGLLAFSDKEKPFVREAIEELKGAYIKVIMLTGDNVETAKSVAERVGIEGKAYDWKELEDLEDEELYNKLKEIGVIARSTPQSKLRIVDLAIKKGHIIGMTGDGINDALALKKAHVGIVMGKQGTDVSKEVGDLILLDDNFYTLVKAIKYGRNLIHNIISFIRFQFTANASAILLTISSLLISLPFPLTPLQVLWVNIIMDGPPALSFGFEKPSKDIMKNPPRKGKSLLNKNLSLNILISSFYIAIMVFYLFYTNSSSIDRALALSFNTFVFFQLFNALNCRHIKRPFYHSFFNNKFLLFVLIVMALFQISINYIPLTQALFHTIPLSFTDWATIIAISSTILIVEEIKKKIPFLTDV